MAQQTEKLMKGQVSVRTSTIMGVEISERFVFWPDQFRDYVTNANFASVRQMSQEGEGDEKSDSK